MMMMLGFGVESSFYLMPMQGHPHSPTLATLVDLNSTVPFFFRSNE
jgi:hypothetical protein